MMGLHHEVAYFPAPVKYLQARVVSLTQIDLQADLTKSAQYFDTLPQYFATMVRFIKEKLTVADIAALSPKKMRNIQ